MSPSVSSRKAYILHENADWLAPLLRELEQARVPHESWFLHEGRIDLSADPPPGVFFNRMSASSHTRGHAASVDYTRQVLGWLESHGRRVVNGSRAFDLEMSKALQLAALRAAGFEVPRTLIISGNAQTLRDAARQIPTPFITKHNRGGKGLGVRLFRSVQEFDAYVESKAFDVPADHLTLLQEFVQAAEPYITRAEFVGGQFQYAIRCDTRGGFELCPADGCDPGEATPDGCILTGPQAKFSLREGYNDPIIERYSAFMSKNAIDVAGIEFIEDAAGRKITYDLNGTTNYSLAVEARHGLNASAAVAALLARELAKADSRPLPALLRPRETRVRS